MQDRDLIIDRILLLIGAIIYFAWGEVFLFINKDFFDPLSHRLIISGIILSVFACSFIFNFVRKKFVYFNYVIIYIVTIQQFHLILHNDFSNEYFVGFIIILVSLYAYFKHILHLILYGVVTIILVFLSFYLRHEIGSSKFVFLFSSTFTINVFLTIIYSSRIKNQKDLKQFSLELIESEEKFRQLMESAPDAMMIVDNQGKIVKVNKRTVELFGFDELEILNKNIEVLMPERFKEKHVKNRDKFNADPKRRGMGVGMELFGMKKDGSEFPIEIGLSPIKQKNGSTFTIAAIRDITPRKQAELELNQAKELLKDQEVKGKVSKAKGEFISKMSHEIRTPLNGIFGFTNLLMKEDLNETQHKYVNSLKFSCDILMTLINDILDFTKFESKKIVLEEKLIDFNVLLDDIIYSFNNVIKDKELSIEVKNLSTCDGLMLGDKNRISQIILNLLSNAIKFSPQGGKIIMTLNMVQIDEEKCMFHIEVKDFGIGILKENQELIFEAFIQGDNNISKNYGGTGLGLSIVKHLVELMEGTIHLESEINKGSTFTIEIPLKKYTKELIDEAKEKLKIGKSATKQKDDFKILLVEDNEINQFLIQTILKNYGYEIDIASNGVEASILISKSTYDLILMDLMMPVMDGFETTNYIRKTQGLETPIIVLTADVKEQTKTFDEYGFNGYLKKPFESEDLLEIVSKYNSNGTI